MLKSVDFNSEKRPRLHSGDRAEKRERRKLDFTLEQLWEAAVTSLPLRSCV